ncbi:MAG: DinB family protein [Chloroflexi bacterium]|nr:DinB family protein [Chloroflexota bacterium]
MLDFTPVREKKMTMLELVKDLRANDLRKLTNEMIDAELKLIRECADADVVFVPVDPNAQDEAAATEEEKNIAWTLGHVVVHATASSEEGAYMSVELARGVEYRGGRSRYETHWTTVQTIAQCRARLEESRKMRLAALDMWPQEPRLENTYQVNPNAPIGNCVSRFVAGLSHDDSHLAQIAEIVRQAKTARK